MDKPMQNQDEMQDKELYALLEQALTEERLCVSEELIQKTLRKIEEQETAVHVPVQKSKGKKFAVMRYTSVAAAAVLLVVLGFGMQSGIGRKETTNEATQDIMLSNVESEVAFEYYSGNVERGEAGATRKKETPFESKSEISYSVSEALADKYTLGEPETGYLESTGISIAVVRDNAEAGDAVAESELSGEYWEFVDREDDWEAELMEMLADRESKEEPLPKTGEYVYALACNDGSRRSIGSEEPLVRIVKVQAEGEILWCLFGEELRVYKEN